MARRRQEEDRECQALVRQLDVWRLLYCHVPNGGARNRVTGALLKSLGVKRGVPDYLIFDAPPSQPHRIGVALEMKRREGGRTSKDQTRWLDGLEDRGWYVLEGHGFEDARRKLEALGYGKEAARSCTGA